MNPEHLEPTELQIECTVRKLKGPFIKQYEALKLLLEQEKSNNGNEPGECHAEALAQPQTEVSHCLDKLTQIRNAFRSNLTQKSVSSDQFEIDGHELEILKSKVHHVLGRLNRISKIKDVEARANYLIKNCEQLSNIFNNCQAQDLDMTLQILDQFDLQETQTPLIPAQASTTVPGNHSSPYPNIETVLTPNSDNSVFHHEHSARYSRIPIIPGSAPNNFSMPNSNAETSNGRSTQVTFSNLQHVLQDTRYYNPVPPNRYNTHPMVNPPESISFNNMNFQPHENGFKPVIAREIRNLKFDGTCEGVPIDKFLYRFEQVAIDYHISPHRLIEELHPLLAGPALEFYWSCRSANPGLQWPQLRQEFLARFQDYRTDNVIRLSLESRKQKMGEPFIQFYNAILNLSASLRNPLSQHDLIFLLMKNMSYSLQYELASYSPHSVAQLVQRCVNSEYTWKRLGSQNEYKVARKYVSELDLKEEHSMSRGLVANSYSQNFLSSCDQPSMSNVEAIYHQPLQKSSMEHASLKCWNCEGRHRYHECSLPIKTIFCFGCGRKNILKPNCINCSTRSSGNLIEGVRIPGNTHSQLKQPELLKTTESACNTDPEFYRLLRRQ